MRLEILSEDMFVVRDLRVRCNRSDEFLPVTESWNRAMAMAEGDYVILLGDDDGLTPNYFQRIQDVIERFEQPDVIYTGIYQFWHRGVAPWQPEPHLLDVRHGFFFVGRDQPFKLSSEEAVRAVTGSLRLRMNFSFNSQAFLYSRSFVEGSGSAPRSFARRSLTTTAPMWRWRDRAPRSLSRSPSLWPACRRPPTATPCTMTRRGRAMRS